MRTKQITLTQMMASIAKSIKKRRLEDDMNTDVSDSERASNLLGKRLKQGISKLERSRHEEEELC